MLGRNIILICITALICSVSIATEDKIRVLNNDELKNAFADLLNSLIKLNEQRINAIKNLNNFQDYGPIRNILRTSPKLDHKNTAQNKSLVIFIINSNLPVKAKRKGHSFKSYDPFLKSRHEHMTEKTQRTRKAFQTQINREENKYYESDTLRNYEKVNKKYNIIDEKTTSHPSYSNRHPKVKYDNKNNYDAFKNVFNLQTERYKQLSSANNLEEKYFKYKPKEKAKVSELRDKYKYLDHDKRINSYKRETKRTFNIEHSKKYFERQSISEPVGKMDVDVTKSVKPMVPIMNKLNYEVTKFIPIIVSDIISDILEKHNKRFKIAKSTPEVKNFSESIIRMSSAPGKYYIGTNDHVNSYIKVSSVPSDPISNDLNNCKYLNDKMDLLMPTVEINDTKNVSFYLRFPDPYKNCRIKLPSVLLPNTGLDSKKDENKMKEGAEKESDFILPDHNYMSSKFSETQVTLKPVTFSLLGTDKGQNRNVIKSGKITTETIKEGSENLFHSEQIEKFDIGINIDNKRDSNDLTKSVQAIEYIDIPKYGLKMSDQFGDRSEKTDIDNNYFKGKIEFNRGNIQTKREAENKDEYAFKYDSVFADTSQSEEYYNTDEALPRRDWEKCFGRKAIKTCHRACKTAFRNVCNKLTCTSNARRHLMRECDKNC